MFRYPALFSLVISVFYCSTSLNASNHKFYLSASMGGDMLSGTRSDVGIVPNISQTDISTRKSLGARSMALDFRMGYLYKFSHYGIGAEFLGGWTKLENRIVGRLFYLVAAQNQYEISQKMTTHAAFHARFGRFLNEWFVYGLAGAHLQSIRWLLDVYQDGGGGDLPTFSFPSNKYKLAPCFGLGFHKALTPQFDVGLEFKATFFKKFKLKWERYNANAHDVHSSFKNNLYSIRLKFTYNI